ncbi:MAG: EVE domain-containing protein [Pyrinomonadaceae bacterium]
MKEEPEKYGFDDLVKDKRRAWTKVKNYQARNYIREMKKGDHVLFYSSGKTKAVVGIAKVVSNGSYPNPEDDTWSCVDIAPVKKLKTEVSLADIKADKFFSELKLIKQSRLSVVPVEKDHFDKLVAMGA